MNVREIMTANVATASPDSTLQEVAQIMKNEDSGAIPVLDSDGRLCGIVTDRDIVMRCIAEGGDPSQIVVEEVLSGELQTIAPDDDVSQALRIMSGRQIRRLPVVDDGELVGMVSLGDVAVKHDDQQSAGEVLSQVSQGVKQPSRRRGASAGRQSGRRTNKRAQAISNRSPGEEQGRQARVSPARAGKRPAARSSSRKTRRRKAS